jgi:hypothetical protein
LLDIQAMMFCLANDIERQIGRLSEAEVYSCQIPMVVQINSGSVSTN